MAPCNQQLFPWSIALHSGGLACRRCPLACPRWSSPSASCCAGGWCRREHGLGLRCVTPRLRPRSRRWSRRQSSQGRSIRAPHHSSVRTTGVRRECTRDKYHSLPAKNRLVTTRPDFRFRWAHLSKWFRAVDTRRCWLRQPLLAAHLRGSPVPLSARPVRRGRAPFEVRRQLSR